MLRVVAVAAPPASAVPDDDAPICPICLNDIAPGTKTLACPLQHHFCKDCLRQLYRHRFPYMPTCPLCRTSLDSTTFDPKSAARIPKGGAMLTLRVGNTHTYDSALRRPHHWELFVDLVDLTLSEAAGCSPEDARMIAGLLSESLVQCVTFSHRSLRPRQVHVVTSRICEPGGRRRFSVARTERWAYSEFELAITVHFRGHGRLGLKHVLCFDGDGSGELQEHKVQQHSARPTAHLSPHSTSRATHTHRRPTPLRCPSGQSSSRPRAGRRRRRRRARRQRSHSRALGRGRARRAHSGQQHHVIRRWPPQQPPSGYSGRRRVDRGSDRRRPPPCDRCAAPRSPSRRRPEPRARASINSLQGVAKGPRVSGPAKAKSAGRAPVRRASRERRL